MSKSHSYKAFKITYIQLLLYGVHVGHSFENSLLYTAWLVYTYTQNILIINLYKSIYILRAGLICIKTACYINGPIWFINLDRAAELYVRYAATSCGEIGWSSKWVNGLISNYLTLYRVFSRLYMYSSLAYKKRQTWAKGAKTEDWFLTRLTWPRAIFVSSVANSYNPVREALYLGIPCLGVVDTDTYCNIVSIAFPGNDESVDCLVFYNDLIAHYILIQKFFSVIRWYFTIRNKSRIVNFRSWIGNKSLGYKQVQKREEHLKGVSPYVRLSSRSSRSLSLSFKLLVGKNIHLDNYKTHLEIDFGDSFQSNTVIPIYDIFLRNVYFFYQFFLIEWIRKLWYEYRYLSRWYLSQKNFKRYHSRSYYHNKVFVWNKFYYYMYVNVFRRNQKFFRKFLKYYYMVKHLNIKVRNRYITSNSFSLFYLKILSNHLVPMNWWLNKGKRISKYDFNSFTKVKYVYQKLNMFKNFRDSWIFNFRLHRFRVHMYWRRKRRFIGQERYKRIIKGAGVLLNKKDFFLNLKLKWKRKNKHTLLRNLIFTKRLADFTYGLGEIVMDNKCKLHRKWHWYNKIRQRYLIHNILPSLNTNVYKINKKNLGTGSKFVRAFKKKRKGKKK